MHIGLMVVLPPHVNSSVREDATVTGIHLLDYLFCAGESVIDSSCAVKISFVALLVVRYRIKSKMRNESVCC